LGISSVSAYSPTQASQAQTPSVGGDSLDMNDFFTLMAAELQNQTMYDTVDNAEYMGQLAQFSMLSQIQEMSQKFQSYYAISLIGKDVKVKDVDENGFATLVTGVVEQASFLSGSPAVVIDGKEYDPANIVLVEGDRG